MKPFRSVSLLGDGDKILLRQPEGPSDLVVAEVVGGHPAGDDYLLVLKLIVPAETIFRVQTP